jgi:hypothetical protein
MHFWNNFFNNGKSAAKSGDMSIRNYRLAEQGWRQASPDWIISQSKEVFIV